MRRRHSSSGRSVISRFRVAGVAVIVGVGLVGAIFYALINAHFLGVVISKTMGPYSDALAEHIFATRDPEFWRNIARGHEVSLLVEPSEGEPVAIDSEGNLLEPGAPTVERGQVHAVRTARDGSRVTIAWPLLSFRASHTPLLAGLIVMLIAVVGSAFWFLHRQLKPLSWLRSGVDAVAGGDFEARVPVVRDDEIGQVAVAFNEMAGRVGEMIDDRERLLADVSHELRSPIARMKVALELLPEGEKRDLVARDLREMEQLVAVLLEREALRSRVGQIEGEDVDLTALARRVVERCQLGAPGVELVAQGEATIRADPDLMKLLIQNLVDNAVKFSDPASGPVTVLIEAEVDEVRLRVQDEGVGIPAERAQDLFEPLVKLDHARGHHVGYGLGLNLCQRIVQLHGGGIELLSRKPRGTEAIVTLRR